MYCAELINNIVQRVIVAPSIQWCTDNLGGTWVEAGDPYSPGSLVYPSIGDGYATNLDAHFGHQWSEQAAIVDPDGDNAYMSNDQIVWHLELLWRNTLPTGTPNQSEPGQNNDWSSTPPPTPPEP